MKKKKGWVRKKSTVLHCGNCEWCNRDLLSNEGGWIITLTKKYFCHDGKDGSCFDQYCHVQLDKQKEKNAIHKV
jgi:hypothetical protein